jgi:hypothetical protein
MVTEWERNIPWTKGKKIVDRIVVTSINNGDYIKLQGVDFSKGASSVDVNVAALYGGKIEVRIDKINGPLLGIVNVPTTSEGDIYKTITTPLKIVTGVHDVFFVFKGEKELFNFDWWQFNAR